MVQTEKVRLVNPTGRKRRGAKKTGARRKKQHRSTNPAAELLSLGFTNPHNRRKGNMAKRAKKRASGGSTRRRSSHRRRKNPFKMHRKRSSGRRRNPGMLAGTGSILKSGFYALLGLVAARQAPQMVLGARNTGIIGYVANLVATVVASMIGTKMLGPDAGKSIALGGGLYMANRVIQDNFSSVGKVLSLSGLGDYTALGDIQPGYFPLPVPTNAAGQPIIPQEIRPMAALPAGKGGMGSVAAPTRYTSRF